MQSNTHQQSVDQGSNRSTRPVLSTTNSLRFGRENEWIDEMRQGLSKQELNNENGKKGQQSQGGSHPSLTCVGQGHVLNQDEKRQTVKDGGWSRSRLCVWG